MRSVRRALPSGHVIDERFVIERILGEGGAGIAYLARDLATDTLVALKVSDGLRARDEFELLRSLDHPSLVRVLDYGVAHHAGHVSAFHTTELVDGDALEGFASRAPAADLTRVVIDILDALDHMHSIGLAHGDVRSDNILVRRMDQRGIVIDMSCAVPLGVVRDTLSGSHLAPEQIEGAPADARSDLYSLGVTLDQLQVALESPLRSLITSMKSARRSKRPADAREAREALGGRALPPPKIKRDPPFEIPAIHRREIDDLLEKLVLDRAGPRSVAIVGDERTNEALLRELRWDAQLRGARVIEHARGAPIARTFTRVLGREVTDVVSLARARIAYEGPPTIVVIAHAEHDDALVRSWLRATTPGDRIATYLSSSSSPQCDIEITTPTRGSSSRAPSLDSMGTDALFSEAVRREERGDPSGALAALARFLLRTRNPRDPALAHRAGSTYAKLGDARRALRWLERAPESASRAALLARTYVRLGRTRDAIDAAERALSKTSEPTTREDLHEALAVALSYAGENDRAADNAARAVDLSERASARVKARALAIRGFCAFRAGQLELASRSYAASHAHAETHGVADLVASSAASLGTVLHQRGELGRALVAYEDAYALARALGQRSALVSLAFNLAKVYADIGSIDRARSWIDRANDHARQSGNTLMIGASHGLAAEIALAEGAYDSALDHLNQAKNRAISHGIAREVAELDVHFAEVALARDDLVAARAHLDEARRADIADVSLRADLIAANIHIAAGELDAALELTEKSAARADAIELPGLAAEHRLVLAESARRLGATLVAEDARRAALAFVERVSLTLSPALREVYWQHPRRKNARVIEPTRASGRSDRAEKLEVLLDINKRLATATDSSDVLARAMDAAIQLTRAERGFVLLFSGKTLDVAIARNIDRGRADHEFSRSIAERVIATGTPVLTVDARNDDRFVNERSVHEMHLQSVACVPIRASEVLGALYLDNRFARGRFAPDDLDVIAAFADQVAIALENARKNEALRARTVDLERERARVAELLALREEEVVRLREEAKSHALRYDYANIVRGSRAMHEVLARADRLVATDLPVLVSGESGTGKELVARALHFQGPRKSAPFLAVNCASMPETLLESELFGHVRGAFTGADRDSPGLFVAAHGGTLFLDELGEMPLTMQAKLLRVLQEGEVRPLGSQKSVRVNVRVIAATNRDLSDEVAQKRFREDLFYRIAVVELRLPPLRARVEDIPALAEHVLEKHARRMNAKTPKLSRGALQRLSRAKWPGNVRELENVLVRAMLACEGDTIREDHLDALAVSPEKKRPMSRSEFSAEEARRIHDALEANRWNVVRVSKELGIPRATLYRKLKSAGMKPARGRS